MICPCDMGHVLNECCGRFLDEPAIAPTPEALMRSRYTAFVLNRLDYIKATMTGPALKQFQQSSKANPVEWLGLSVLSHSIDPKNNRIGHVEFIAKYHYQSTPGHIHEKSEFRLIRDRWFYFSGKHL